MTGLRGLMTDTQVTMNKLRKILELCDGLQGFLVFHSFGGRGTTSINIYFFIFPNNWINSIKDFQVKVCPLVCRRNRIWLCFSSHGETVSRVWEEGKARILNLPRTPDIHGHRGAVQRDPLHPHHPRALRLCFLGGQPGGTSLD